MAANPLREHAVTCPDCGAAMKLRVAHKAHGAMQGRPFYGCSTYPRCKATHNAHPDGAPMGIPGDASTKAARVRAHAAFDQLWKGDTRIMRRGAAYGWLEAAMGLKPGEGHIANFDVAACDRLVALIETSRSILAHRAQVRTALNTRFGGRPERATVQGRLWLARALGLGDGVDAFVRDLDDAQCARAMKALSALPPLPEGTETEG